MIILINDHAAYVSQLSAEEFTAALAGAKWNSQIYPLMGILEVHPHDELAVGAAILVADKFVREFHRDVLVLTYDQEDHTFGVDKITYHALGPMYETVWDVIPAYDLLGCLQHPPRT